MFFIIAAIINNHEFLWCRIVYSHLKLNIKLLIWAVFLCFILKKILIMSEKKYNDLWPHFLNHYLNLNEMHEQSQIKMRAYKNKNQSKIKFTLV